MADLSEAKVGTMLVVSYMTRTRLEQVTKVNMTRVTCGMNGEYMIKSGRQLRHEGATRAMARIATQEEIAKWQAINQLKESTRKMEDIARQVALDGLACERTAIDLERARALIDQAIKIASGAEGPTCAPCEGRGWTVSYGPEGSEYSRCMPCDGTGREAFRE